MKTNLTFVITPLAAIMIFVLQNLSAQNTFPASGQVGIGTTSPTASSILEIRSGSKGILIPRMTTAQRGSIMSPANGLLVYQTNNPSGFYYYNAGWTSLANSILSNLTGSAIPVNLVPGTDNSRNLGSPDRQWKNLYLGGFIYLDASRFVSNPGTNNTFVGALSGNASVGAINNGVDNTGLGYSALKSVTSGTQNVAVGSNALFANTTGSYNTANGFEALRNNDTGLGNTSTGFRSLWSNTSGDYNTANGIGALLANSTGGANTATGLEALIYNTEGSHNTATGVHSLRSNLTGNSNTAVGEGALGLNTTGNFNTACGTSALPFVEAGIQNVGIGLYAGSFSGQYTTSVPDPSFSTFLGGFTAATGSFTNVTAIGYQATVTASDQIRLGNTQVTSIGGPVNWSVPSDGRYKKNVHEDVPGLKFIKKLRPVTYNLDIEGIDDKLKINVPENTKGDFTKISESQKALPQKRNPKDEKEKLVYTGFIAQEVEALAKQLNYNFSGVDVPKNNQDFYGLRYAEFVVPLVKAVQELASENESLKNDIRELSERLKKIEPENTINTNLISPNSASLEQNMPNPAKQSTLINYFLPDTYGKASIRFNAANGETIKVFTVTKKGRGQLSIQTGQLIPGVYTYSLIADGKVIESKSMIVDK